MPIEAGEVHRKRLGQAVTAIVSEGDLDNTVVSGARPPFHKAGSTNRSMRRVVAPLVNEIERPSSPAGRHEPGDRASRSNTSNQRSDNPHSSRSC